MEFGGVKKVAVDTNDGLAPRPNRGSQIYAVSEQMSEGYGSFLSQEHNEVKFEIKEESPSGKVKVEAQEEGFLDNLMDFNSEDIGLGLFVPNLKIIEDVDKFRYDVKDNRKLNKVAVWRVFNKTGKYIFNLGIVNYLELIIVNLFLVIHAFYREEELFTEQ